MFLPTTRKEIDMLGWDRPDVILVSGDTYIDSPFIGAALVGKALLAAGYKTAIIAQPDPNSDKDIARLGEPRLFWGVTGGCVDSMVANRTASGKRRKRDDFTPGGVNDRRPDRAVIAYSNLIRRFFKRTVPIVLGGVEASLRRVAHYDFWSNKIRRSILFDAKANYLLYGMADRSIVELAAAIDQNREIRGIRGLCFISAEPPENSVELPSFQEVSSDKRACIKMFNVFYRANNPAESATLIQKHDNRHLVQNPPAEYLTTAELDSTYALDFEREVHPHYRQMGSVRAIETIRFSITTHRGCCGECNFCAIAVHQGSVVRWRGKESILAEAEELTRHPEFKGIITDIGGPTANMFGTKCDSKGTAGSCVDKRCLFPKVCPNFDPGHDGQIGLLRELRALPNVKKVFVASGVRYDMILADSKYGDAYLRELVEHHVSGQMKIAPEHSEKRVLDLMGKPDVELTVEFKKRFDELNKNLGRRQFLTYYTIVAHPGCGEREMRALRKFAENKLRHIPEQSQIFTPTPSTYSTLMYWTGLNPFTDTECFVEKNPREREKQKKILLG